MHKSYVHQKKIEDLTKWVKSALRGLNMAITARGQIRATCLPFNKVQLKFEKG